MGRFIVIVAIIAVAGYFAFKYIESDKANNQNSMATMEVDENSSAFKKIIKKIMSEN